MGFLSCTVLFTLMVFLNPVRGLNEVRLGGVHIRMPDGSNWSLDHGTHYVEPVYVDPRGYNEVFINGSAHQVPNGSTLVLRNGAVSIHPGGTSARLATREEIIALERSRQQQQQQQQLEHEQAAAAVSQSSENEAGYVKLPGNYYGIVRKAPFKKREEDH